MSFSFAPSSSVIPPFNFLSQIPSEIGVDFIPENDGDCIAHCNLNCGRFLGDDITFYLTSCLHVVCGSCRDQFGEFEGRPVCPVCQERWSGMEISGLEDPVVETYFQDPFQRIEAILDANSQYDDFYEDQMEKFNKLFLEVTDRHKKACTENLAWTAELRAKEDQIVHLDHEIEYLRERKRQLESNMRSGRGPQGSQYYSQRENSQAGCAYQNSPALFASQNSHVRFGSQNSHVRFASQNFQDSGIPMTPRDYQSQAPPEDFTYQATPSQVHIHHGTQRSRYTPQNTSHQTSQQFQNTAKRSRRSNRSSHHSNLVPVPAPAPSSRHEGSHRSSGHRSLVQRHTFHFQRSNADVLETHDPAESPRFLKPITPGEGVRLPYFARMDLQRQASQSQRQYDPNRFYNIEEITDIMSPVGSYGNVSSQWTRRRM